MSLDTKTTGATKQDRLCQLAYKTEKVRLQDTWTLNEPAVVGHAGNTW